MNVYQATDPLFALRATDAYLGRLGTYDTPPPAFGRLQLSVHKRLAARGQPARTFQPAVGLSLAVNASGVHVSFNRVVAADGTTYGGYFAPGRYDIAVHSPFYRVHPISGADFPAPGSADLRTLPLEVDLEPGYDYPFPRLRRENGEMQPTLLRGRVESPVGEAAGYRIEALRRRDIAPYLTGDNGQWLLVIPEDVREAELSIRITAPDGQRKTFRNLPVRAGETTTAPVYKPTERANR